MSEMVERVARALRESIAGRPMIEILDTEEMARAAIEAMREPTQEQYNALCATNKIWAELDSLTVWQTYIDAATKDAA